MGGKYREQWNNTEIFLDFDDVKIVESIDKIKGGIELLSAKLTEIQMPADFTLVAELSKTRRDIYRRSTDLKTFCHLKLSVDGAFEPAKALLFRVNQLVCEFEQVVEPLNRILVEASNEWVRSYLADGNQEEAARIRFLRMKRPYILNLELENALKSMSVGGFQAWGDLYKNIGGTLRCKVESVDGVESMSLGKASSLRSSTENETRRATYHGIHNAWREHGETCATILNSMISWRLKEDTLRSKKQERHFLDLALEQGRLSRQTLDVLLEVVESEGRLVGHRAAGLKAQVLGKERLDPWDELAGLPSGESAQTQESIVKMDFQQAMDLVAKSCEKLGREPAEFVKMMGERGYIDALDSSNRNQGAYCTGFLKDRTPRVFMTFAPEPTHAITLAHELGHAYHGWVMRDMSVDEIHYPMTLAETASTFFETIFKDSLQTSPEVVGGAKIAAWQNIQACIAYLTDIPRRFFLEKDMYKVVASGERLSPNILRKLVVKNSERFYGDTVNSHNEDFWLSKMHFYIPSLRFYNFPYIFGYLFSMYIYDWGQGKGDSLLSAYNELLRDCGRMSCEDLAEKHLGVDISQADFWRKSISIVRAQIDTAATIF